MEQLIGFEPMIPNWKSSLLPLKYNCMERDTELESVSPTWKDGAQPIYQSRILTIYHYAYQM
jgi:hypothetical protein